jgi:peptidoglycan hydrolase-like protein with peptidoglycan-binding domain
MTVRARTCALTVTAVALVPAIPAHAAEYGSRTMREGMSGGDISTLQRYLSRTGIPTTADGAFGPRTARSVRRFEGRHDRPVDGIVPPRDAAAIKRVAMAQEQAEPQQAETGDDRARITRDGLAVAPSSAPTAVKRVIAAGNRIAKAPYRYGGGHGNWND